MQTSSIAEGIPKLSMRMLRATLIQTSELEHRWVIGLKIQLDTYLGTLSVGSNRLPVSTKCKPFSNLAAAVFTRALSNSILVIGFPRGSNSRIQVD